MLSPSREVAKALDTNAPLMPEAGEGFDFTSYLECVARLSGRKKLGKTIEMIVIMSVCIQENPLKDSRKAR